MLGTVALGSTFVSASAQDCESHSIVASAVQTPSEVRAFVRCAKAYLEEMGPAEAYRAFHHDERWRGGQIYIFVNEKIPSSYESTVFVHPIRRDKEGETWGALPDQFGDDIIAEGVRIVQANGRGFWYYAFSHPVTGLVEPKVSYVEAVDWKGSEAFMGAGIYLADIPGSCHAVDVNAEGLTADASNSRLERFVRCAALEVESLG